MIWVLYFLNSWIHMFYYSYGLDNRNKCVTCLWYEKQNKGYLYLKPAWSEMGSINTLDKRYCYGYSACRAITTVIVYRTHHVAKNDYIYAEQIIVIYENNYENVLHKIIWNINFDKSLWVFWNSLDQFILIQLFILRFWVIKCSRYYY